MLLQHAATAGAHPLEGTVASYVWLLPLLPLLEQVTAAPVEPFVQLGDKIQRSLAQDLAGTADGRRFGNDPRAVEHDAHNSTGSTQIE